MCSVIIDVLKRIVYNTIVSKLEYHNFYLSIFYHRFS